MATGDLALGQEQGAISARQRVINDFSIIVATVNGSGSQSANSVLLKSIFGMGVPVSGKNLFPSNIAGLPTWYTIRASKDGYVARKRDSEVLVALNPETAQRGHAGAAAGRRGHLRGELQPQAVSQTMWSATRCRSTRSPPPSAPRPSCASWSRTWSTWAWLRSCSSIDLAVVENERQASSSPKSRRSST